MFKNTAIVTFFLLLSSLLGFAAQIVYTNYFGASIEMDIYFKLLSVPTIITGMAPVVFASVLLPAFAKFGSNEFELNQYIHSLLGYILLFSVAFTVFGCYISITNIDSLIPNMPVKFRNTAIEACIMVWIGSGLSLSSGYLSAVLNYNKKFFRVSWTSILPALLMILSVLILQKYIGIRSITSGFLLAFLIQFLIFLNSVLPTFAIHRLKLNRLPQIKILLLQTILAVLSLLPFTIIVPIGYFWASYLQEGSVSYLGYSQSFAGFLSVATGMGIAIVSFPDLAKNFAEGNHDASLVKFESTLRYVLLISVFIASAFIALRIPILTLFYKRGSFTSDSVQKLASVAPWYLIAAVFTAGLNLLRTLFYSRGDYKQIAILGVIIPIIFLIIAGFLKEKFTFVGIGIANSISFALLFFITVSLAKVKNKEFLSNKFILFLLKVFVISIFSGYISSVSFSLISLHFSQIIAIIISLSIFGILFFLSSKYVLKLVEVIEFELIMKNKVKSILKL